MSSSATMLAQARALVQAGRKQEAVPIVEALAAAGDAEGLFTLAVWQWRGAPMAQDLPRARALFASAGEAGHDVAAPLFTNLLANGIGGAADWQGALRRLRDEARLNPRRAQILSLIGEMELDAGGAPLALPPGERLSEAPEVTIFPKLLSGAECDYLGQVAEPNFQPSMVVDLETGREQHDPIRTSDGAVIHWLIEDPAIHALSRRLAAASGTSVAQGEPLQILRYRPGQQYRNHRDAIVGFANQRVLTILVYLNEGYGGGETCFVRTGLKVKGGKGDALLFRNTLDDGSADPLSEHAGLPIASGVKLLASRWIRQRPHVGGLFD